MNRLSTSLLAVLVVASIAGDASAKPVPLKGEYAGQAVSAVPVDADTVFVTTVGGGKLTHLGKFTFVSPHLSGLFDFSVQGQQILTAANGDTVVGEFDSQLELAPGGFLVGDIEVTIVGGTGRFANATGSYTFSIIFELATLRSVATIDGEIDYGGK
jgi:hypothetical protein